MAEVGRGEIWQYSFPLPDRRRPVLVLTRNEVIAHLGAVTVAPITRTIRGIPTEVVVGEECGLKTASAINLDNLATVPKHGLRSYVGAVSPDDLERIRAALLFALGFSDQERIAEAMARYVAARLPDERRISAKRRS